MFKGLIAVTCLAALAFFGWFGWSEYQRIETQRAQIETQNAQNEAELEAWGNQALKDCRAIVAAWDAGDEAPARAKFADVSLGMKSCRTLIRLN